MVEGSPLDDVLLQDLLTVASPPGHEAAVQRLWVQGARPVADKVESDAYGNTWAVRKGSSGKLGPKVLLEAHADEIAISIRFISDDGFLHIGPLGGSDLEIMRGRRVLILGSSGPVHGIIGNTATHLRKGEQEKHPKWPDLYIDIGSPNRAHALATGVQIGSAAVLEEGPFEIGEQLICGRGLDNRIGGYILLRVLSLLQAGDSCAATIYAANCVQEEIGGPGSKMAAYRISPDLAIVLDVTHATDTPGIDQREHGRILLGGGPTVTHSPANHPEMVARLTAIAATHEIPLQHESASRSTGTDTDEIYPSRAGIPSALVSLPMRYMHSPVECVHWRDVEATTRLLVAFLRSLGASETFHTETGANPVFKA
jgi:endoglucanase